MTSYRTTAGDEPVEVDSLDATGAVTGASVAATGAVTGATVTATGAVSGSNLSATGQIPVTASAGQPLHREAVVTWESSAGAILTVPDGEYWIVGDVVVLTPTAWDGAGADLDIGVVATIAGTDTDGLIDGSAASGILGGNGLAGLDESARGALMWDTDHAMSVFLIPGDTITATPTAGTGASAGSSRVFVTGARFMAG